MRSVLPIFSMPRYSTALPSARFPALGRPSLSPSGFTSSGGKYSMPPCAVLRAQTWFSTIPCVSSLTNGSSMSTSLLSRIALVQKRA